MNHTLNGRSEKFTSSKLEISHRCSFCGSRKEIAGPIWNGPLHDNIFIDQVLTTLPTVSESFGTVERIEGMLTVCQEELPNPLYFSLNEVAHVMKISCPPLLVFRSAFLNAGYKVSISHCNPRAIKSDAPPAFFWSVIKAWISNSGELQLDQLPEDSLSRKLIETAPDSPIDFKKHPDSNPPSRQLGLCRFQENPKENWGPLARARPSKQSQI